MEVERFLRNEEHFNVTYYAKFFCHEEAEQYFQQLQTNIEYYPKEMTRVIICGRAINIPRDQVAFSDSGLEYRFSGTAIPGKPWIKPISDIKRKIEEKIGEQFNFCLVNRYKDGTHSIGQHSDDETQLFSDAPIIAVSFGEERKMVFESKQNHARRDKPSKTIPLQNGSVLVMHPPTNRFWTHGIPKDKFITRPRISLTFRKMKLTD